MALGDFNADGKTDVVIRTPVDTAGDALKGR